MKHDPALSVVVCSYNARAVIDRALSSLARQETTDEFEVIVVDSGRDGTADHITENHPSTRLIRPERRLWPAAARNQGVAVARAPRVAFVPADGRAGPRFVAARLACHREGAVLVGGSVVDEPGGNWISRGAHQLEYSALQPSQLSEQSVPHAVSYDRRVFDRIGRFPEELRTGEDTVFNARCLTAGLRCDFAPEAWVAHRGPETLGEFWSHQLTHGCGLAQLAQASDLEPHLTEALNRTRPRAALHIFLAYPIRAWFADRARLRGDRPAWRRYLVATPIICLGRLATAFGFWRGRNEPMSSARPAANAPATTQHGPRGRGPT